MSNSPKNTVSVTEQHVDILPPPVAGKQEDTSVATEFSNVAGRSVWNARESRYAVRHPLWLRTLSILTSIVFLWTTLLTLPVQAVAQTLGKPAPANPKLIPAPAVHDDPSWHTVDYHKPRYTPTSSTKSGKAIRVVNAPGFTLLDEVGRLAHPVAPATVAQWKAQLHASTLKGHTLSNAEIAKIHVLLGEYTLAHDEQPEQALWHFEQAQHFSKRRDIAYGLAAYDRAITAFNQGAYNQSQQEFTQLLRAKPGLRGFDQRTCANFLRHARACAGYHAERAEPGTSTPLVWVTMETGQKASTCLHAAFDAWRKGRFGGGK